MGYGSGGLILPLDYWLFSLPAAVIDIKVEWTAQKWNSAAAEKLVRKYRTQLCWKQMSCWWGACKCMCSLAPVQYEAARPLHLLSTCLPRRQSAAGQRKQLLWCFRCISWPVSLKTWGRTTAHRFGSVTGSVWGNTILLRYCVAIENVANMKCKWVNFSSDSAAEGGAATVLR